MNDEYYNLGKGRKVGDFVTGFLTTFFLGFFILIFITLVFHNSYYKLSLTGTIIMLIYLILNIAFAIRLILKGRRRFIGIGMIVPIVIIIISSGGCSSFLGQ